MHRMNKRNLILLAALAIMVLIASFGGLHFLARYHHHAAQEALERRDFREANVHLQKYLDMRPDDLAVRLLAVQTARRQGNLQEAATQLEIYTKRHGPKANLEKRLLRLQFGDLGETGVLLAQCVDEPDSLDTPLILEALMEGILKVLTAASQSVAIEEGELAPEQGRARQALELWQRLRTGPVDQAQGLIWRSRLHQAEQNHSEALADLHKALEIAPECADARLQLALLLFQSAPADAAEHLQRLYKRYPEDPSVMFWLAVTSRHLGRLDEAASLLDKLLAASPDDYNYLLERGNVAINANRLYDAERWLRRAHAASPTEPLVNLALSGCLRRAGRDAEAQVFFDAGKTESDERTRKQEEKARKYKSTGKKP